MLALHPEIHTGFETQFFATFHGIADSYEHALRVGQTTASIMVSLTGHLTPPQFYGFLAETFWRVASLLPTPRGTPVYFLEKSPNHCLDVDVILRSLPNARFIHLIRDCRQVVASTLRSAAGWAKGIFPETVDGATHFWSAA